jgi:hypothetical protein
LLLLLIFEFNHADSQICPIAWSAVSLIAFFEQLNFWHQTSINETTVHPKNVGCKGALPFSHRTAGNSVRRRHNPPAKQQMPGACCRIRSSYGPEQNASPPRRLQACTSTMRTTMELLSLSRVKVFVTRHVKGPYTPLAV